MQAMKFLIVFALAATAWANSGSITVHNSGAYVTTFSVAYTLNGERKTEESANYGAGVAKTIEIPGGATNIFVKSEVFWFITSRSTIFTQNYNEPVQKCFKVWGTTLNTKSEEVTCPATKS